jgi:hypothetical protein
MLNTSILISKVRCFYSLVIYPLTHSQSAEWCEVDETVDLNKLPMMLKLQLVQR